MVRGNTFVMEKLVVVCATLSGCLETRNVTQQKTTHVKEERHKVRERTRRDIEYEKWFYESFGY